jgi:hypothetical protein
MSVAKKYSGFLSATDFFAHTAANREGFGPRQSNFVPVKIFQDSLPRGAGGNSQ